ncbi:MAG: hypothetical protein ACLSGS_03735 [Adlercreutzia sp.]
MGYRCMKSVYDLGEVAEKTPSRWTAATAAPSRYSDLRTERTGELGGKTTSGNTCAANFPFKYMEASSRRHRRGQRGRALYGTRLIGTTIDELGLWCNYAQLWRDLAHCIKAGVFDRVLPRRGEAKYDWQRIYNDDPTIMVELLNDIAQNDSEMPHIAYGPYHWTERWDDKAGSISSPAS